MEALLKEHAIQNVWCSPDQDNQVILAAQRITRPLGEQISFPIMARRLPLPTNSVRYHVFQIGQIHPGLLGLLPHRPIWALGEWISLGMAVDKLPLFADVYTDQGVHIPLYRVHYLYTPDRALIFAVDLSNHPGVDYESEQLYLRLYTNEYYRTTQSAGSQRKTRYFGQTINRIQDILALQSIQTGLLPYGGYAFCYVNGRLVPSIDPFTTQVRDTAEILFDESVKRVVDFKIEDLKTFTSTLDDQYKYLLHPPKLENPQIDYLDDVDFYILHWTGTRFKGHFFHRNLANAVRMVSHQDYSLRVDHVERIAEALARYASTEPVDIRQMTIRAIVRKSGLPRPLYYDHYRLFELYKLPDTQIEQAMVGVDAVVPFWTAASLEASGYTRLMGAKYRDINVPLLEAAYGYNAITKALSATPLKTRPLGAAQEVQLPPGLHQSATVYEYDGNGLLLGFYPHTAGSHYLAHHAETRMVEGIVGQGTPAPQVFQGTDNLPWPANYNNRLYRKYRVGTVFQGEWEDVTEQPLYELRNGLVKWLVPDDNQWLMVRSDSKFLAYSFYLNPTQGVLYFDLTEIINGQTHPLSVPLGDLDLWINGRNAIYGLDYTLDFPRIYLTNKDYLKWPIESNFQHITVRFTGFADEALRPKLPEDYGFVIHGVLSNNRRYDVRDDKNLRISVRGQLKHHDDLTFSEFHNGISILDPDNGSPYQIKDVVQPIRGIPLLETYRLREDAEAIDAAVEAYMTLKLPQPERPAVSAIPSRYFLVSPFLARLVDDLDHHRVGDQALQNIRSDSDVEALCQPYLRLLEIDPITTVSDDDARFVQIHPTLSTNPVGLDLYSYRFIQRVVALYGRNRIQVSPHLVVQLGS